jgi:hypothetical protein
MAVSMGTDMGMATSRRHQAGSSAGVVIPRTSSLFVAVVEQLVTTDAVWDV